MVSAKKWIKLTVTVEPVLVETVTDYLIGIHNMAVEVATEDEIPNGVITAFAERESLEKDDGDTLAAQVLDYAKEMATLFKSSEPVVEWEFFEEEDWGKKWKQHFKPFAIVPNLIIAPTWEQYQKKDDERVIEMDPGMAFGTGHHATTSLSLEFIKEIIEKNLCDTVLDVGCGTGVLTMAAALFGAQKSLGIDNCPDAVKAAKENVAHNHLQKLVEIAITPIEEINQTYDLVVANIVHDVLASMSYSLSKATKKDGYLVLSGVLKEDQADSIAAIFTLKGFTLIEKRQREEWAALLLQKE